MNEIKKEQKFMGIIIPMKDMDEFFDENPEDLKKLNIIDSHYQGFRVVRGRTPLNRYIIINQDEPYAEKVWDIVLEGERRKTMNYIETMK